MLMINILILIFAVLLLLGLLYFEKKEIRKGIIPLKSFLSLLFFLTAIVQAHPVPGYYYLLLFGLGSIGPRHIARDGALPVGAVRRHACREAVPAGMSAAQLPRVPVYPRALFLRQPH